MSSIPNHTAVLLQARMGSSRLPGKVLAEVSGRPLLSFLIERLKRCELVDEIILATTSLSEDDVLEELGRSLSINVIRGSEDDVLSRFEKASSSTTATTLARITGDCPLIDPDLLTEALRLFRTLDVDYLSNNHPPSYPDGLDIEIFTKEALVLANANCNSSAQREHVTPWIRESGALKVQTIQSHKDFSSMRWTVDEPEDLQVIRGVIDHFGGSSDFSWEQVLDLAHQQPHLFAANARFS